MVGDKVLVRNVRQENRKGGKLDPDMLGPFTVVKIEEKIVDVVSKKGTIKFNTDHLIEYVEPEPHIPKKWIPSNSPSPPPAALPSSTKGLSAPNNTSTNPCLKGSSDAKFTLQVF